MGAADLADRTLTEAMGRRKLLPEDAETLNEMLLMLERSWLADPGLAERPWFRSLYAATDPDSGYAAWLFPEARLAVERGDQALLDRAMRRLRTALDAHTDELTRITQFATRAMARE